MRSQEENIMNDPAWQDFLNQIPLEYREMMEDVDFQNAVINIYANSKSKEDAHLYVKSLIEQYKQKALEFEIWKHTHPFQWCFLNMKVSVSVICSRIKSLFRV